MSNQYLKLRRSAVPGKIPDTSSIDFGEIALNTYDGLAFMKKSGPNGVEIVTLGSGGSGAGFPYSGSAVITGSLLVSQSGFKVIGNTLLSGSSDFILGIHAKDGGPWAFGIYNDTYNPTQSVLAGFVWDNGKASIGTEVDTPLEIYTNARYNNPTLIISSSGVTIDNTLTVNNGITGSLLGTASYYAETDPVFVAVSASLATTGSNLFTDNQIIGAGSTDGFGSAIKYTNQGFAHYTAGISGSTFVIADTSANYYVPWAGANIKLQIGETDSTFNTNLSVTGSLNAPDITGSLQGTASWSENAVTSSYPISVNGSTLYSVSPLAGTNFNTNNSIILGDSAGNGTPNAPKANFIGYFAGNNATNAYNSNFIGLNAGAGATNAAESNFIGDSAGNNAPNASYSNLIGYYAGATLGPGNNIGSNNIIIGTNISLPDGTQNAMNLGGVIFATDTYSDFDHHNQSISPANGKVGINVVTPTYTLEVSGTVAFPSLPTASQGNIVGIDTTTGQLTVQSSPFLKNKTKANVTSSVIDYDSIFNPSNLIIPDTSVFYIDSTSDYYVLGDLINSGSIVVDGILKIGGTLYNAGTITGIGIIE
jgi:hypothetical protein